MTSITVGRIVQDGRHSLGLRFELADARIAAGLSQAGVAAKLYTGKPEGRVVDVVRHLIRMRTDHYLFGVSDETLPATARLAQGVKQHRPDAGFTFWSTTNKAIDANQLEGFGRTLGADTPEHLLLAMMESGIVSRDVDLARVDLSPYRHGLLTREQIAEYGLDGEQPTNSLKQELAWLQQQRLPSGTVIPIKAMSLVEENLLSVCKAVEEAHVTEVLELWASAQHVTPAVISAMSSAHLSRLVSDADVPSSSAESLRRDLTVVVNSSREAQQKLLLYGRNGLVAAHVGLYPDPGNAPAIQHLEVPLALSAEERKSTYEWAASNMLMRSAAILTGSSGQVGELLPILQSPQNQETMGWPKHTYAVGRDSGSAGALATFDGSPEAQQPLRYVPLSKLASDVGKAGEITFVTMEEAEDLLELESRLHSFHSAGILQVTALNRSILFENSCRWLAHGACRLESLRRLQVVAPNRVTACRDAGEIGRVGDSYDGMVTAQKQHKQMEEVRRGCAVCPVRHQCSQCVHLPQSWGGRYCEIRIAYPQTQLYFTMMTFLHILAQFLPADQINPKLRISFTDLPLHHYTGVRGEARTGQRPVIVTASERILVWWPGTRKLFRISEPLALMAEAWWSGAAEAEVVQSLSRTFGVSEQEALASFEEGSAKLRAGEVIHG